MERTPPEKIAWPCDNCLSRIFLENEGILMNLCLQTTIKKDKEPEQFIFVSDPSQVEEQLLTFSEATHSVEQ